MPAHKKSDPPRLRRLRRWQWAVGLITLLVSVALLVTPLIVRQIALQQLRQLGVAQAAIEDIDINPFSAVVRVRGLGLPGEDGTTLAVGELRANLDWWPLWRRHLYLQSVELHDANIDIRQRPDGGYQIGGLPVAGVAAAQGSPDGATPAAAGPWGIGIGAISISNVQLHYRDAKNAIDLDLPRFSSTQAASWLPDQATTIDIALAINDAPAEIHGELRPFAETPTVQAQIRLDDLDLGGFGALAADAGVTELRGRMAMDLTLALQASGAKDIRLTTGGVVSVRDLHLAGDAGRIDNEDVTWKGEIRYGPQDQAAEAGLRMRADSDLKGLRIETPDRRHTLLALDRLDLTGIAIDELQDIRVATIAIARLRALADAAPPARADAAAQAPVLSIETARVERVALTEMRELAIDRIAVDDLRAALFIDEGGALRGVDVLPGAPAKETSTGTAAVEAPAASAPVRLRLQTLEVGGDSAVRLEDHSVQPPFKAELRPLTLKLSDLDSGDAATASAVDLRTRLGEFTPIAVTGTITPGADPPGVDLHATVSALELPPLSPYAVKYSGYNLRRGQLDATIALSTGAGRIDANAKLILRKFKLEAKDAEQSRSFAEQFAMPLDASLDLLRDKHDNIKLELQLEGDIKAPDFDLSKVINRAMGNALKMATLKYAAAALQPWGSLMTIANVLGKATALRFEPVIFGPGTETPAAGMPDYLDKLAALLVERPKLQLTVCGRAGTADREALFPAAPAAEETDGPPVAETPSVPEAIKSQLIELADRRGRWVKEFLVGNGGIDPGRLFTCRPTVDTAPDALPRVDLFL